MPPLCRGNPRFPYRMIATDPWAPTRMAGHASCVDPRHTDAVDAARYALWVFLRMDAQPRALEQWLARPYREAMRFGASTRAISLGTAKTDVSILEAQRAIVGVIEAAASGAQTLTPWLHSVKPPSSGQSSAA